MLDLQFIVTGTGRCGTVFMVNLLTKLGLYCGHEGIFNENGWERALQILQGNEEPRNSFISGRELEKESIIAEASYMATPYLSEELIKNVKVVHLVRHPLMVIDSFCNGLLYFTWGGPHNRWEKFIYSHLPDMFEKMNAYDRASLFYIQWNEMIESQLHNRDFIFHRIEDDLSNFIKFVGKEGFDLDSVYLDKQSNSFVRKRRDGFSVDKIENFMIRRELIKIGERYGYDMEEKVEDKSSQYLMI